VMSLHTKIAHIKKLPPGETIGYGRTFTTESESVIATIPIGYQDGYSRTLSNNSRTIVNGQYAPVVGRISMDWTTIDVTGIADAKVGDVVTLIGESGGVSVSAEDLARATNTISYEITCGVNRRVPRIFTETDI